jgi:serine protease inhibitor
MRTLRHVVSITAAFMLAACRGTDPNQPPVQLTALPRDLTADEVRVATASNHFALTLFRRINAQEPDKNVFVSPLSVSFSLGMAMNGASGATLDQMRQTLGFGADDLADINAGYRGLLALEAGLDPTTTFEIANSVWHRNTFPFHQNYLDLVQTTFDADVMASPFDEAAVTQVNEWVSSKTGGRIPTILEEISGDAVMFLINAIYFKGAWRDGFNPAGTSDGPFTTIDGSTQTAKLMRRGPGQGTLRYGSAGGTTVGELSYGNGAFVMTLLVPQTPSETVNQVVASLDTATWRGFVGSLREADFEVVLPRFTLQYERELSQDLKALGMSVPFQGGAADFSAMSPAGPQLFIGFVKHKTFVRVDEVGTEAAAVTNTGVMVTSLPPALRVTRPFIFVIRERFSGTILFIGKIGRIPN